MSGSLSTLSPEQIYALLPAIYRTRDAAVGEPLKALIGIIAEQVDVLEQDLRGLYADQFIETCAPWVVPYIGDLIGWTALFDGVPNGARGRAEVANTIGYRRRKGTVLALEQLGRDVTGRMVHVVEYFRRLAVDESFRHFRPQHKAFVDFRRGAALEHLGGPFDTLNRTVDVRRIAPRVRTIPVPDYAALDIALHGGGRFNIPDIGAWVWRWIAYPVRNQAATKVDARRFMVSPLGADMPLFNAPAPRESFAGLTARIDAPQPIGRREFHDDLSNALRHPDQGSAFYGTDRSLQIYLDNAPVPLADICVCNLSDTKGDWAPLPAGKVAIDPKLGRIAIARDLPAPTAMTLDYAYGFPADLGGGPYDRTSRLPLDRSTVTWQASIGAGETDIFGSPLSLEEAVGAFNASPPGTIGLILLAEYMVADIDLTGTNAVHVQPGSQLWIVAAQVHPDGWSASESRAVLHGNIELLGIDGDGALGQVVFNGILLAGSFRISGRALDVGLQDCTLVPGRGLARDGRPAAPGAPSLTIESPNALLTIDRGIVGPIYIDAAASARVTNSIIDATANWRVAYAGPDGMSEGGPVHIEDSTVVGKVRTRLLPLASNTIFIARRPAHDPWAAAIWCTRRQSGCVRFCFVPTDAITPGQYRCLPGDHASLEEALAPQFVSLHYGSPSYLLLSGDCPIAVWQGADDESQIGAYHLLYETQGIGNLRVRIAEYLPFGLEAGIFLVPSRPEHAIPEPLYTGGGRAGLATMDDADALHWLAIGAALI